MKKNLVPLLGIAFVVAIVATGIFYGLFVSKIQSGGTSASSQSIVVAARAIDRGTPLQKTDLKLASWGGEIPKGAFTSLETASGATALHPMAENEPILQSRVATASGAGGSTGGDLGIPTGMRAVSVQVVLSSGIVSVLRAGYRVDVQLVSNTGAVPELRTILQNIEVYSVQQQTPDGRSNPVVTLLVSPQDADGLALGDSSARIRLTLRNPLDTGITPAPRTTMPPLIQGTPGRGIPSRPRPRPPATSF